jgi:hypothetical protein
MFDLHLTATRRLAAPLTLSLIAALAAVANAGARPAPDEEGITPAVATPAAHTTSNLTWSGTPLVIAIAVAVLAAVLTVLVLTVRHRRPVPAH